MTEYNFLCNKNGTDKGDKLPDGNDYANFYEKWFSQIKYSCKNILEIGIDNGGSLRANYEYFPNSKIIGLDILEKKEFDNDRVQTFVLDQGNYNNLDSFCNYCRNEGIKFDIIIDDGSHSVSHQQKTFGKFFNLVKDNGIYIIEDLGTSYFIEGVELYGQIQTKESIENNTILFLNQRPFYSPWINQQDINYINDNVESVSVFDKLNIKLSYSNNFNCFNNYPLRSITSLIKKKIK